MLSDLTAITEAIVDFADIFWGPKIVDNFILSSS